MFFEISLYTSLAIFGLGLIYKVSAWFRRSIGVRAEDIPTSVRLIAATRGIVSTFFSPRFLTLLRVLILDVIFQAKILREDGLRWAMHMLIYGGFMLLLLMHALDGIITEPLFSEYASTLNPFMFLRDLFGLMVIVGIAIAIYRRMVMKAPRFKTNSMDLYAIIILAVIMLSGIFLEATKITSHTRYQEMVEDYADTDDEEELQGLESFWVKNFAVISPTIQGPFDEEVLTQGGEIHETSCASCHSKPGWAFTGYVVAKITKPVALGLDKAGIPSALWYIHFLACFIGLAYLPFSKMFHIIASPISLLVNGVTDPEKSDPANIATRQVMELDACTHCGTCSLLCSAGVAYEMIGNVNILPSEKMVSLKALAAGKSVDEQGMRDIQEGVYLCTNCERCTVVCPVGINLKDLWFNVRENLIQREIREPLVLSPFSFYRGLNRSRIVSDKYTKPLDGARKAISDKCESLKKRDQALVVTIGNREFRGELTRSFQARSYAYCFECQNCTTVCPVVNSYENPEEVLDLLPHQIIRSVGLGLKDLALGSRMLWDCLTCYQCQEHCPQDVDVTDVLYELKNQAIKNARTTTSNHFSTSKVA